MWKTNNSHDVCGVNAPLSYQLFTQMSSHLRLVDELFFEWNLGACSLPPAAAIQVQFLAATSKCLHYTLAAQSVIKFVVVCDADEFFCEKIQ